MAASDLAKGVGMIKLKARHPLLPGQIRRQSLKLPKSLQKNLPTGQFSTAVS